MKLHQEVRKPDLRLRFDYEPLATRIEKQQCPTFSVLSTARV